MEARKEAEEDHHRCCRVHYYGLDDVPDYGYEDHGAKDLGSV